jgi:hypothetical protein
VLRVGEEHVVQDGRHDAQALLLGLLLVVLLHRGVGALVHAGHHHGLVHLGAGRGRRLGGGVLHGGV